MKKLNYWIFTVLAFVLLLSCDNESKEIQQEGNPVLEIESQFVDVHFGDLLSFAVNVSDNIPLSVLTAKLYFGDEAVATTTIRTKDNGRYEGKIRVPFQKNIPDGTATLEFTLRNTTMKTVVKEVDVPVTRASYPYLILVTESGSYPMLPTGNPFEYAATEPFPSTDLPAYIQTPVLDDKGSKISFGWEGGTIIEGSTVNIPFVSPVGGEFSVTFNTRTYEAAPFFELLLNGQRMNMVDKENYEIDIDLQHGQEVHVEGLGDIEEWWIDSDYFDEKSVGTYTFAPITGKYRVAANLALKYFRVEALDGASPASLKTDGTGAIWVIGTDVGKPSVAKREVGWEPSRGLCMAPVGNKKYQLTVVAGESVKTESINFKFFHQKGWGGEFKSETLTTASDLIFVGDGENGRDNGNLGIVEDKMLEAGTTYVFVVDLSAGNDNGVLTVTKK